MSDVPGLDDIQERVREKVQASAAEFITDDALEAITQEEIKRFLEELRKQIRDILSGSNDLTKHLSEKLRGALKEKITKWAAVWSEDQEADEFVAKVFNNAVREAIEAHQQTVAQDALNTAIAAVQQVQRACTNCGLVYGNNVTHCRICNTYFG